MKKALIKSFSIILGSIIIAISLLLWDSFQSSSDQVGATDAFVGQLSSQAYVGIRGTRSTQLSSLNKQLDKNNFCGTIFNVTNGQVNDQRGFGYANYSLGLFNDWDTPMDVGNINNLFAFLVLVHELNNKKISWDSIVPQRLATTLQSKSVRFADLINYDYFSNLVSSNIKKRKIQKLVKKELGLTENQSKSLSDLQLETGCIEVAIQLLTNDRFSRAAQKFMDTHALTHTYLSHQRVIRGNTQVYSGEKKNYQKIITKKASALTVRANNTDIYAWISMLYEKNMITSKIFNGYISHTLSQVVGKKGTATSSRMILNLNFAGIYTYIVYNGETGDSFILRSNYGNLEEALTISKETAQVVVEQN